jgi:hypothetical protein
MNKTSLQIRTLAAPENPGPSTIADAIQLQAALHLKRPADRLNVWRVIRRLFFDFLRNRPLNAASEAWIEGNPSSMDRYRRLSNYLPPFIDTELFCLVCDENAMRMDYSPLAWTNLSRVGHFKRIPGGHFTCIFTFAGELANELRQMFSTRHSDFS